MKLILTFDYELFLGEFSGTVEKSIIKPTACILDLLSKYNAKGIFFVDASYLSFIKDRNHKDFEVVSEQLKEIVRRGNNVELHLHPQWIDAYESEAGGWRFSSYAHYRLHSFSESEITNMFIEGKLLLEKIIGEVIPGYKITAFRAGGWSITPFDKLYNAFITTGIALDFSVLPESYMLKSDANYYDFRGVPNKAIWKFDADPLKENEDGRFVEVPCTRYTRYGFMSALNKILNRDSHFMGDGSGVKYYGRSVNLLKMMFYRLDYYFTIDYTAPFLFIREIKSIVSKNEIVSVYSHPKCYSKNSEINLIFLLENFRTLTISDIKATIISL